MAERNDEDAAEVGYKRPPKSTRFKPGESGNPAGRPKGTLNLKTVLEDELSQVTVIRDGDRDVTVSKQRALVKTLVAKALGGDLRAANLVVSLSERLLRPNAQDKPESLSATDQEILNDLVEEEIRRREMSRSSGEGE